jgi:anti-sigma factor RsiW
MTIAKDIIRDLLPAYWSGEASAATRAAIEASFAQDPAFAEEARRSAEALVQLPLVRTDNPDAAIELSALRRARRVLRTQRLLFALASTLTLNAVSLGFSFEVGNGHVRVHWLTLPGQAAVVGAVLVVAIALWALYARTTRRVRTRVLGEEA